MRLNVVAIVEAKAHRTLAALLITAVGSAQSVADIVIDNAIVNEGAGPVVEMPVTVTFTLIDFVGRAPSVALAPISVARDHLVERQGCQIL